MSGVRCSSFLSSTHKTKPMRRRLPALFTRATTGRSTRTYHMYPSVQSIPSESFNPTKAFTAKQPVLVKGYVNHWPAINDKDRAWRNSNRFQQPDMGMVQVEVGRHYMASNLQLAQVEFKEFADHVLYSLNNTTTPNPHNHHDISTNPRVFLAQNNLDSVATLKDDVIKPAMTTMTGKKHLYRVNIWMCGASGSESPCHYDPFHNLLCQVFGSKRVLLFPPAVSEDLYPAKHTAQKNTSLVDFQSPDHHLHPRFVNAQQHGLEAILEPGDALYIPYQHWHYCTAHAASCSVNFWWL